MLIVIKLCAVLLNVVLLFNIHQADFKILIDNRSLQNSCHTHLFTPELSIEPVSSIFKFFIPYNNKKQSFSETRLPSLKINPSVLIVIKLCAVLLNIVLPFSIHQADFNILIDNRSLQNSCHMHVFIPELSLISNLFQTFSNFFFVLCNNKKELFSVTTLFCPVIKLIPEC